LPPRPENGRKRGFAFGELANDCRRTEGIDDLQNVEDGTGCIRVTRAEPWWRRERRAAVAAGRLRRWPVALRRGAVAAAVTEFVKTFPRAIWNRCSEFSFVLPRYGLEIRFCFLFVIPLKTRFGGVFYAARWPAVTLSGSFRQAAGRRTPAADDHQRQQAGFRQRH